MKETCLFWERYPEGKPAYSGRYWVLIVTPNGIDVETADYSGRHGMFYATDEETHIIDVAKAFDREVIAWVNPFSDEVQDLYETLGKKMKDLDLITEVKADIFKTLFFGE